MYYREYHNPDVVKRQSSTRTAEIPEALRSKRRWMGTRLEKREDGRVDKPPYRVVPGKPIIKADKTDPENWASFPEALAALQRGDVDAIGFVFMESDPFYVVDVDKVIDPDTGEAHEVASEIIHTIDTYTEVSCSGRGVHLVGIGSKPEWSGSRSKKMGPEVEIYDSSRFMVMTGVRVGAHSEPQQRGEQLYWLCQKLWSKAERLYTRPPQESVARDMEDDALLERARRSRTGKRFAELFDSGNTAGFTSPSEADFALMNMLAFWTAGDPERMARLFETSALYRKEKGRDYPTRSAHNALKSYKGGFYQPRSTKKARKEDPKAEDPLTPYLEWLLDPSQWTGRKGASAFKTVCGIVCLVEESGVVDADGNLRIGADCRRLAEASGTSSKTLRESALPHLMQEMKVLKWRRGKAGKAGTFILKKPPRTTYPTKVSTHFNGEGYAHPKNALNALRELARMRSGSSKGGTLLRLGMPAMFVLVAMCPTPSRGYTLDELAEATGRRKRTLDSPSQSQSPIKRLKGAGIIREISHETYRFTAKFGQAYQRNLELSGITYAEHRQRERHRQDREARRKREHEKTDQQPNKLKGKDQMRTVREQNRNRERERDRWIEEQRKKVGATVATFLADELKGVTAMNFHAMRLRFQERGGNATELWRVVHNGPWCFYREADGDLYVRPDETPSDDPPTRRTDEERIKGLVGQGMSPKWARAEVAGGKL